MKFLIVIIPIFSFIFVTLLTKDTLALSCYVCNSRFQPDCTSSPPPEIYNIDCSNQTLLHNSLYARNVEETPKNYTTCRKEIFTIPEQNNNQEKVHPQLIFTVRTCGYIHSDSTANSNNNDHEDSETETETCNWDHRNTNSKITIYACKCGKDACNFGERKYSNILLVFLLLALSPFTFYI